MIEKVKFEYLLAMDVESLGKGVQDVFEVTSQLERQRESSH